MTDQAATDGARGGPRRTLLWIVLALGAIAGGGIYAWEEHLEDQIVPRNFGVVEDGEIYRSGRLTPATMRKVVEGQGIRTIIDLGAFESGSPEEAQAQETAEELGVQRFRFDLIGDGTGNPNYYVQAIRLMNDPRAQPILVQCGAGSQRTGACVMFHRRFIEGVPFEDSYPESFEHRHDPGSDWKMITYVAEYNDEILEALRTGGQVPGFERVEYPLGEPPELDLAPGAGAPPADESAITSDRSEPSGGSEPPRDGGD